MTNLLALAPPLAQSLFYHQIIAIFWWASLNDSTFAQIFYLPQNDQNISLNFEFLIQFWFFKQRFQANRWFWAWSWVCILLAGAYKLSLLVKYTVYTSKLWWKKHFCYSFTLEVSVCARFFLFKPFLCQVQTCDSRSH